MKIQRMKTMFCGLLIGVWSLCAPFIGVAQDLPQETEPTSQRQPPGQADIYPKVGVVLSGGGARGFAHVGALKVIEEVGIPIDYIVGTSMGSIVGGLYAIGYSTDELVKVVNEVDWEDVFSDTPPRNLWPYQKKQASTRYLVEIGFNRKGFTVPRGLTSGQKISNLLAFLTLRASEIEDFDKFPIPYRAVAADIATGEEVVLDHGSLADAMRASMSVPGIFTPVKLDGHLLVDGGVVKNLPVDVVKHMGADIIIAIDISSPLRNQEELKNPLAILNQMVGLQIVKSTEEQRKLADVVIIPDLGKYSSTSFGNASEIIALGEQATRMHLNDLQALSRKIKETRPRTRYMPSKVAQDVKDIYIEDIVVEGNVIFDEQILLKQLQEQLHQPLNPDLLEKKITEIFSTGKYESVKFKLTPGHKDGKILKLDLQERVQGPHQIRFGINYESRFDDADEDKIIFLANVVFNNLTGTGSSWSTDLEFVNVTKLTTEYVQPLGKGFFVAPLLYDWDDYQLIYEGKESVARYNKHERGAGIRLGTFIRRMGEVNIGFLLEDIHVSPSTAVGPEFAEFDEIVTSVMARSRLDQLDTFPFPMSGNLLSIDYQWASKHFGGDVDFHRLLVKYWRYFSFRSRNTLGLRLEVGTDFQSDLREYKYFSAGGRDSFVGYKAEELRGPHLGIFALEYRYRFYELPSAVGGGIFATATANVGNVWNSMNEIKEDFSLRYGGSLGIGVDTILGAVRADFAMGDEGRKVIYLNIGYKF